MANEYIRAIVKGNLAMLTLPNGSVETVEVKEGDDIRRQLMVRSVTVARTLNQPLTLVASGDIGEVRLHVAADGTVTLQNDETAAAPVAEELVVAAAANTVAQGYEGPVPSLGTAADVDAPIERDDLGPVHTDTAELVADNALSVEELQDAEESPMTRRTRRSFIETQAPIQVKSSSLWRRTASAFGINVGASPKEIARESDRRVVSAHHGGCRRTSVGNGKGGIGKTTTAAMLAAVYAREGGGGVLAWDNNPTRGSLGWRTESATHDATVQDLLDNASRLLDPSAPRALIDEFVHHQVDDRYDVLRSNPELLAIRQQINEDEFDLISSVVDRHYRRVIFDSGNDESASRWLRMIDLSHQLVVPTTGAPDSAESGMLLLQELSERDEHSRQLAENAVVVLTHTDRRPSPRAAEIRAGFEEFGATVHEIPFDPALQAVQLRFGLLAQETQDAWLRVAAAAAGRV